MSTLPSTIHFENLVYSTNKNQESTDLDSKLDGSSPSRRRNTGLKKCNREDVPSSTSSDKDTIFQLHREVGKLRQQLHLSDDSTTSTKHDSTTSTSFTSSTTMEEEDELEKDRGELAAREKENEILERENRRIMQDLSMREKEVNALAARCAAQENKLSGLREARVMGKEIGRLNEEIERKDIAAEKLNEELMRTKSEATRMSEKVKEVGVLKCKEIDVLQNITNKFTGENKSLGDEVAKLKTNLVSKDTELKESRSTITIMTKLKLDQEEKLQSIHSHTQFLVSSIGKLKKDHSNKTTALKLDIDQLKSYSEKETIAFQQNVARLEQLEKIVVARDQTIERQRQCHTEMEKELAEKAHLVDEAARQKNELEEKNVRTSSLLAQIQEESQLRLQEMDNQRSSYLQLQKDMGNEEDNHRTHLKNEVAIRQCVEIEAATLKLDIDQLKSYSEKETIAFQQNVARLEQLEKIVVARDQTIELQRQCHTEMEKELAEKAHLVDEAARQKNELEEKNVQTSSLLAQIQEESQLHLQEMDSQRSRYLQLQKDMKNEEDNHRKHVKNEVTIRQGVEIEMKAMKTEVMELKKQGTGYTDLQKKCFYLEDKVERQENYLKKKLQQERRRKLSSTLQASKTLRRRESC